MGRRYIDFALIKLHPNKYNITPKKIKKIKVLDWEKLKKNTWFNKAMNKPCWCHLCGCEYPGSKKYNDFSEFWIGFYEDGRVDYHFSTNDGMCRYEFDKFYDSKEIEHKADMQVQVNAISYLNFLIDNKIIEINN